MFQYVALLFRKSLEVVLRYVSITQKSGKASRPKPASDKVVESVEKPIWEF
jgi:hypothetical protein